VPERIVTVVKETKVFVPLATAESETPPDLKQTASTTSAPLPPTSLSFWSMQQQALRFGVEGLPSTAAEGADGSAGRSVGNADLSLGAQLKQMNQQSFSSGEP
jgi:hypothetical protein